MPLVQVQSARHDAADDEGVTPSIHTSNKPIIAIGITSAVLLVLLYILLIIANKKRKNIKGQGE